MYNFEIGKIVSIKVSMVSITSYYMLSNTYVSSDSGALSRYSTSALVNRRDFLVPVADVVEVPPFFKAAKAFSWFLTASSRSFWVNVTVGSRSESSLKKKKRK